MLGLDGESALDLEPYIQTAELVINEDLSDKGLSDDRLNSIALYLSAHFAAVALERGGIVRESMGGDYSISYKDAEGSGAFGSTRFGLQAMALDTSGTLSTLSRSSERLKAEFRVL